VFKITKDLSKEKITGYTFQGAPIVLSKRRGRPPKTRAKPTWYPLDKKVHAACVYGVTGSLKESSRLTDIPESQLRVMMTEVWWEDTIKQIREEENASITAKMTTIIDGTLDAMKDRLENGDTYLSNEYVQGEDGKYYRQDKLVKLPVKMKDLTMPIGILTDKRQLLRGEATSITGKLAQEDILKQLATKFEGFAKALNIKEPETIDAEVIEHGSQEEEPVREEQEGRRTQGNERGNQEGRSLRPEATEE
jgi:hypothetical protein